MAAGAQQVVAAAAAQQQVVATIPTKREDQKLKLLSKQVLGLTQAEHESGTFNADLIMTEALIQDIREDRSVVKDLCGKAQEKKQSRTGLCLEQKVLICSNAQL